MVDYYQNDFDSDTTGLIAPGWTDFSGAFVVGTTNPISSPNSFGDPLGTTGYGCLYTGLSPDRADADLCYSWKQPATFNSYGAVLRASHDNQNCYILIWSATQLSLYSKISGGFTEIETITRPFSISAGLKYTLRARVQGTSIKLRVWRWATAEPDVWHYEKTDSSVSAAGTFGFYVRNSGVLTVDDVLFESPVAGPSPPPPQVGPIPTPPIVLMDADSITGKSDGDTVAAADWPDDSGQGNGPTSATGGIYKVNIIGSHPVVRSDGTKSYVFPSIVPFQSRTALWHGRVSDLTKANYIFGGNITAIYLANAAKAVVYQAGAAALTADDDIVVNTPVSIMAVIAYMPGAELVDSFQVFINGAPSGVSAYPARTLVNADPKLLMGAMDGGSTSSYFDTGYWTMWDVPVSGGDANLINAFLTARDGVSRPQFSRQVIFFGDSMTVGWGLTGPVESFAQLIQEDMAADTYCVRFAAGNELLSHMVDISGSTVEPLLTTTDIGLSVVVVFAGTNDIAGAATAAATLAKLWELCDAIQAAGGAVVVVTMLPRTGTDAVRATYNTGIRDHWEEHANALADVAADPDVGPNGANNDTDFYAVDAVHPNAAGHAIIAPIIQAAIEEIPLPPHIHYAGSPVAATVGTSIGSVAPTLDSGDAATSYAITTGSLPGGLSFNTGTGVFTGTPTTVANTTLGVTPTNDGGDGPEAEITFDIEASSSVDLSGSLINKSLVADSVTSGSMFVPSSFSQRSTRPGTP